MLSEFLPSAHNQGAIQFELTAEVRIFLRTRGRRKVLKDSGRKFRKTWWQEEDLGRTFWNIGDRNMARRAGWADHSGQHGDGGQRWKVLMADHFGEDITCNMKDMRQVGRS